MAHWKELKREPKKNTLLQRALKHDTAQRGHTLEKKLDAIDVAARKALLRQQKRQEKRRMSVFGSLQPNSPNLKVGAHDPRHT